MALCNCMCKIPPSPQQPTVMVILTERMVNMKMENKLYIIYKIFSKHGCFIAPTVTKLFLVIDYSKPYRKCVTWAQTYTLSSF